MQPTSEAQHRTTLQPETALRVGPSQCLALNADAIKKKLPQLWNSFSGDQSKIRHWFEKNLAITSEPQLRACRSSDVSFCGLTPDFYPIESIEVSRQPRMGRAAILELSEFGEHTHLDLKGIGVAPACVPDESDHGTGVLSLERAAREYVTAFALSNHEEHFSNWKPSSVFAILSLPIKFNKGGVELHPVILVREATLRDPLSDLPFGLTSQWEAAIDVEMDLRKLGLTTAMKTPLIFDLSRNDDMVVTNDLMFPKVTREYVQALLGNEPVEWPVRLHKCNVQLNRSWNAPHSWKMVDYEMLRHLQWVPNWRSVALVREAFAGIGGLLPRVCDVDLATTPLVNNLMQMWAPVDLEQEHKSVIETWESRTGSKQPRFINELVRILARNHYDESVHELVHYFNHVEHLISASETLE